MAFSRAALAIVIRTQFPLFVRAQRPTLVLDPNALLDYMDALS